MKLKNLFNIFLVLVLVSVSVYYVIGGSSIGSSFTTPTDNQYIARNTTFTITFNSSWRNVTMVALFNISNYANGADTGTTLNISQIIGLNNTGANNYTSVSIVLYTLNYTQGNYTFTALIMNSSSQRIDNITSNITTLLHVNSTDNDVTSNITSVLNGTSIVGVSAIYVNVSVIIDNIPPDSLTLIAPLNITLINNDTIQFGFNVTDSMSGNRTWGNPINCTLSINGTETGITYVNSSIVVGNLTTYHKSNASAHWFNVSSTNFGSGYHIWNISCADYNNNINSSLSVNSQLVRFGGNFTLTDTSGPSTSTPTFSASSVTQSASVIITCTGTDTITLDSIEYVSVRGPLNADWQEVGYSSPYTFTGTDTVGTYTVRCRSKDGSGNFGGNSAEATFAVTKNAGSTQTATAPGSGGSSGGPSLSVNVLQGQTKDLGAIAGGVGTINAYQSSTVTFSVVTSSGGATVSSHSIKFDEVSYIKGTVTVTIKSDPIILTLNVGDVKNVDVDGDGTNDLEVTLNSIDENGQVNMKVKDIIGVAPAGEETQTAGEETQTAGGEETKGGSSLVWWLVIIIIVVVIIALVLPKKKGRK